MRMHSQNKPRILAPHPPLVLEILEDDLDDNQYIYSHGLSDNVDQFQNKHFPYDIENDGQDFYNRLSNVSQFKQIYL